MILESTAITTILGSLSTIYTAYSKIKSNKERCKQLVDRCELIAERLKAILTTDHDSRIVLRIGDLEMTFKTTADTITKVGEQSYIVSLLRTEENSALIEDAQRALTELITTLSLETIIDVSAWQRENEIAVRKEFAHVKKEIRQLDKNFSSDLAGHGATLDELLRVVDNMAKKLGEPLASLKVATPELSQPKGQQRTRSWSSPTGVRPSIASILDQALPPDVSEEKNAGTRRGNRPSLSNRHRPSLPAPPFSAGCESGQQRVPAFVPSPLIQSHMSRQASPLSQLNDDAQLEFEIPDDPPPPYTALSWEDEMSAAYERIGSSPTAPDRPANSRTSTHAVRALDSPSLENPVENDPFLKVRQSLKRKEINNFSAMKSIGHFGKINTRVLVEMWLFPKNRAFDTAVPLDCFEPTQRDKLQLIRSRAHQNKENADSVQTLDVPRPEYNRVLLLCPLEARPTVIVMERKQSLPQQVVKAYILDSVEPMTLVSVKQPNKTSWLLIPYYPDMPVRKAKQYISRYFGNVLVDSCSSSGGQSSELNDNSTLLQSGVQAYDHNLSMRVTPIY